MKSTTFGKSGAKIGEVWWVKTASSGSGVRLVKLTKEQPYGVVGIALRTNREVSVAARGFVRLATAEDLDKFYAKFPAAILAEEV